MGEHTEHTPGPIRVACPICRRDFTVPSKVLCVDETNDRVLVALDRTGLYGHLTECAQSAPVPDPPAEVAVRPTPPPPAPLPRMAFVARGARPCLMCGASSTQCLESLRNTVPCCGACGEGNTHPAKHESMPCAVWADQMADGPQH